MVLVICIAIVAFQEDGQTTLSTPEQIFEEQKETENPSAELELNPLHPILTEDSIGYSLQSDELNITYNNGKSWTTVPVAISDLFSGEYNGNQQELIENSFVLNKERAAFLYTDGQNLASQRVVLKYSMDQGNTWQDGVVSEQFPVLRFRKVAFLNDQFGYVILSGDRTMSQEYSVVFITNDGGVTWKETNDSGVTRLISDGGFIDETTGFLSFGTINPEEPDFYVTQNSGESWTKSNIQIPTEFKQIFVTAEIPFKEDDHLAVLINQGPNGDYQGGKVKGKFISTDNGLNWTFQKEVVPCE